MWLLSEKLERVGVGSEGRLLMAASNDAVEDSALERFLVVFLGRGAEDAALGRGSVKGLLE